MRPEGTRGRAESPKRLPKHQARRATAVGEARATYTVAHEQDETLTATTRLTGKNQITLPVEMVRRLGLEHADEVNVTVTDAEHIVLTKRYYGQERLDRLQGSMAGVWGNTKEEIDEWLREERASWDRDWDPD